MKDELKARAAIEVLRRTGLDVLEAALVARAAIEAGRGRAKRAYACIAAGAKELQRREKTVTFERAVTVALEDRTERRKRTLSDLRYVAQRFMRKCPGLAKRRVRTIHTEECIAWINEAFDTPSQRKKARAALSGIFGTAMRHGWCSENPVRNVPTPMVREQRIRILTREEEERLLETSRTYKGGICLPAVATMLYAGVRPHEVARLTWEQIHVRERVICIQPEHSKTGGARHVTIQPRLARVLRRVGGKEKTRKLCPPNWVKHWTRLHHAAGWGERQGEPWQQDVLRHTFATRFLKVHRSYHLLQVEMGHRSSDLLRTRYVAM